MITNQELMKELRWYKVENLWEAHDSILKWAEKRTGILERTAMRAIDDVISLKKKGESLSQAYGQSLIEITDLKKRVEGAKYDYEVERKNVDLLKKKVDELEKSNNNLGSKSYQFHKERADLQFRLKETEKQISYRDGYYEELKRNADLLSRLDKIEKENEKIKKVLAYADNKLIDLQFRLDLAEKDRETIQLIADDGLENLKKMKVRLDLVVITLESIKGGDGCQHHQCGVWATDTLAKLKVKPHV